MWHLFRRKANQAEIDEEIEAFLAEKTEALMAEGMTRQEASERARREFGNVTLAKELSRAEWRFGRLEQAWDSIRYALRSLARNPGFAATVVLTLGVGIGINAAIFNLLHAVVLRSLPVRDAQELRLFSVVAERNQDASFSYPVLTEMQRATAGKASIAAFSSNGQAMARVAGSELRETDLQLVSGNFFDVAGVTPQAGRLLNADDDRASGTYPAVISGAYWSREFGRSPRAIGQSISLNDAPVTIVGVAADSFFGMRPGTRPDFWLPVSAQQDVRYRDNFWNSNGDSNKPFMLQAQIRWLTFLARVESVPAEQAATAAINAVHHRDMEREVHGRNDPVEIKSLAGSRVRLDAGEKGLSDLRQRFTAPLLVLMAAAAAVLLIACLNLASLSLARVVSRRREIAVRCSLGAGSAAIAGHLAAETLLLALAGGALSAPVAIVSSQMLLRWASKGDPLPLNVALEGSVVLFTAAAAFLAGLLFGAAPALYAMKIELSDAMKTQATAVKGSPLPWGRTLVAAEVSFSVILLTGAVLFVRTFLNYSNIALGFSPQHVISLEIDSMGSHLSPEELKPVYRRAVARLLELPQVRAAAAAGYGPVGGWSSTSGITVAGKSGDLQENEVTPGYFETVGIRLLSGRFFNERDTFQSPVLAVINSAAAKLFFPNMNPIGQHYGYGHGGTGFEVAGVVADARVNDVHDEPRPMAYYSLEQKPAQARNIEIRVDGDPARLESELKKELKTAAPELLIRRIYRLTDNVAANLLRERLIARLATGFAALALTLACLGVYGVLSYATTRRTSEMGVRLALGAQRGDVLWMVLREAFLVIGVGLLIGIPCALAALKFVKSLLYGVSAGDWSSFAVGAGGLLIAGSCAALIPAWRASRVDPNTALRYE